MSAAPYGGSCSFVSSCKKILLENMADREAGGQDNPPQPHPGKWIDATLLFIHEEVSFPSEYEECGARCNTFSIGTAPQCPS